MSAITRRVRRDDSRARRWIVAGPAGAIEYHELPDGFPLGIEHHSPRPLYEGMEPCRCAILEGPCYPDGTSLGAETLRSRYLAAGCDEEVIWRELESRYRSLEVPS